MVEFHLQHRREVLFFITDAHNMVPDPALTSYPYSQGTWLAYFQIQSGPSASSNALQSELLQLMAALRKMPSYLGSYFNDGNCLIPQDRHYLAQNTGRVHRIRDKYDPAHLFRRPTCPLH